MSLSTTTWRDHSVLVAKLCFHCMIVIKNGTKTQKKGAGDRKSHLHESAVNHFE